MENKIYTFVSDAGHGWLSVAMSDLKALGIEKKISSFSYRHNDRAYLEEDDDAGVFLKAYKEKFGKAPRIKEGKSTDRSYVRSYYHYYT